MRENVLIYEIYRRLHLKVTKSLESQRARMNPYEVDALVAFECDQFAEWLVKKYESEKDSE